jgi:hypothetical protein
MRPELKIFTTSADCFNPLFTLFIYLSMQKKDRTASVERVPDENRPGYA